MTTPRTGGQCSGERPSIGCRFQRSGRRVRSGAAGCKASETAVLPCWAGGTAMRAILSCGHGFCDSVGPSLYDRAAHPASVKVMRHRRPEIRAGAERRGAGGLAVWMAISLGGVQWQPARMRHPSHAYCACCGSRAARSGTLRCSPAQPAFTASRSRENAVPVTPVGLRDVTKYGFANRVALCRKRLS